jgi:steroid delta-isomerase-like uncharacterized protein
MLTVQDHAALTRAIYDAYNERAFEEAIRNVTEDVRWVNLPFGTTWHGPSGCREFFQNSATAFPDSKVEVKNVIAGAGWTCAEFIGRGTHSGPLKGPQGTISATGRRVEIQCCQVFRIRNGKIAEAHLYFDGATVFRQLGVMPLS